jgi:hypothetical protein
MITSAVLRIEEFRGQSRASIIALVFPVQSLSRASKLLLLSCCCYSSGSWLVGRARRLGGGEPTSRACRHTWTHRAAPFHCQWHVMSRPFHLPRHEAPDGSATEPRARALLHPLDTTSPSPSLSLYDKVLLVPLSPAVSHLYKRNAAQE